MPKSIFGAFLLLAFNGILLIESGHGNMKIIMEQNQIVPDIISEAPESSLKIVYDGNVMVDNGAELTPTQVKSQPMVTWEPESNAFYSLMMVSPDAPSREKPTMKDLRNWMVVNIPGNDITKGDTIVEYIGSGAPAGSGLHRYVILLYKQTGKTSFNEERSSKTTAKGRFHTSTKEFVGKYNLGVPVAGNFFQAQYDDYVPEIHKQISVTF